MTREPGPPHDLFLSSSSKDERVADAVYAGLEARGIRCWMAPHKIRPGTDWGAAIIEAIETSKVMVLIFSAHANASE
ncbi:MAG: toll/interleukin-1 receptor domain-containing protein [Thermoanaerobaculia bacterium]